MEPSNNHSKPEMNTLDNTTKNTINNYRRVTTIARNKHPRKSNPIMNRKKPPTRTKLERRRKRIILLNEEKVTDSNARIARMMQSKEIADNIAEMIKQAESGNEDSDNHSKSMTDSIPGLTLRKR